MLRWLSIVKKKDCICAEGILEWLPIVIYLLEMVTEWRFGRKADKEMITKHHAYFKHVECEYFPCHKTSPYKAFNCMFCFCPLYALGERCGGKFTHTRKESETVPVA